MGGCIYRTKDGECELWENDRNHSPFCNPECPDKHPSNADRIRAMTDEELATWLGDMLGVYPFGTDQWNRQAWLDWLRQEATE